MKNLVKLLSLLLALCMVLCACGTSSDRDFDDKDDEGKKETTEATTEATTLPAPTDEELLEGEWTAFVDCGPVFNAMMKQSLGAEVAGYLDFTGAGFDLTLTFDGTDSYSLKLDQDSLEAFADDVVDIVLAGMRSYLTDSLSTQLDGQSLDEYLAAAGTSFEALMIESGLDAEALADTMVSSFDGVDTSGKYSVEEGKLKLDSDVHPYELDGDNLTIEIPDGNTNETIEFLFPMELTKTN